MLFRQTVSAHALEFVMAQHELKKLKESGAAPQNMDLPQNGMTLQSQFQSTAMVLTGSTVFNPRGHNEVSE